MCMPGFCLFVIVCYKLVHASNRALTKLSTCVRKFDVRKFWYINYVYNYFVNPKITIDSLTSVNPGDIIVQLL